MLDSLRGDSRTAGCRCRAVTDGDTLVVDGSQCPNDGHLASSPACRRSAIESLRGGRVSEVRVETGGTTRHYQPRAVELLLAAARFAQQVETRDPTLASQAMRDPLEAAATARSRAGLVGDLLEDSGLRGLLVDHRDYEDVLRTVVVPSIATARIDPHPPADATLRQTRVLESGATARLYDVGANPVYHLEPLEYTFDATTLDALARARRLLVEPMGEADSVSDQYAAVREAAGADQPTHALAGALEKHTTGLGVFEDLFSDPEIEEVFVNAPAADNPLRVRRAGEAMGTNIALTDRGVDRLAARIRSVSGRPFSRAAPTVDALLTDVGEAPAVRIAGVRKPVSDGPAFALRVEGTDTWRLSSLVELGTLTARAAGLLSVAMERGSAILVAGPRGAGKTTLASSLLWELPEDTRLLAIEDTPELPIRALQAADRDAQRFRAAADSDADVDPDTALHTALRFGDGALAVGEVRGEEAQVLYEAMRVGAASDTVLGTIHGEGYDGVRERVVSDLGVPASSFAATDLLVTIAPVDGGKRVLSIEEVTGDGGAALFEFDGGSLEATPRMDRGNSRFLAASARPGETYGETLTAVERRTERLTPSPLRTDANGRSQEVALDA